jgi:alpha-mannosidase
LLLNGVFAYDTVDNHLRLTLLRSPIYGDLRVSPLDERIDYQYMEQGVHTGCIRYIPQNLKNSVACSLAAHFNNPPTVVCESNHNGDLPASYSGLSATGKGLVATVLKEAENKNGFVLRFIEYDGKKEDVKVCLDGFQEAEFTINPYEIKTMLFSADRKITELDLLENPMGGLNT